MAQVSHARSATAGELVFTVIGIPQPKGSGRAYTYRRKEEKGGGIGARIDHDNPKTKSWARTVATHGTLDGPVSLELAFYLPRPKYLAKRAIAPPHITRPDVDKLARAVADALTGVAWVDDAQVTRITATKVYAGLDELPRAVVTVRPVGPPLFELSDERTHPDGQIS